VSLRSYHAFIKAARKTGGLSLPAARRSYHAVSERLGEPAKAKDIKAHPVIFRDSLRKREREQLKELNRERRGREKQREEKREKRDERERRRIESLRDFRVAEGLGDAFYPDDEIEYASTAEY